MGALATLRRRIAAQPPVESRVWGYNCDNHRNPKQVEKEIRAILANADELYLSEAYYRLPHVPGFDLFHDTSNRSRENIAAYIRTSYGAKLEYWIDLKETWGRTNDGASGQHEPRSYPVFSLGRMLSIPVHQPPNFTDNTADAQHEGLMALIRALKPKKGGPFRRLFTKLRPVQAVGDFNSTKGDRNSEVAALAAAIHGEVVGIKIDCAVVANMEVSGVQYVQTVPDANGNFVKLESDHGHAFRFTRKVSAFWLRRRPRKKR